MGKNSVLAGRHLVAGAAKKYYPGAAAPLTVAEVGDVTAYQPVILDLDDGHQLSATFLVPDHQYSTDQGVCLAHTELTGVCDLFTFRGIPSKYYLNSVNT